MFKSKRSIALLLSSLLLGATLSACKEPVETIDLSLVAPKEANYQTVTLSAGDYVCEKRLRAVISYLDSAELRVEESGAKFGKFLVKNDQEVKEGDPLFTYTVEGSAADLTERELTLTKLQNDTSRHQSTLSTEMTRTSQTMKMVEKGSIDYQIAACQYELLQSQSNQLGHQLQYESGVLEKQIDDLEERLEVHTVKAPIDGKITQLATIREGDLIDTNLVLCAMHSGDRVLLELENDPAFRYGDVVQIEAGLLSGGKPYEGRVVSSGRILPAKVTDRKTYIELLDTEDAGRLQLAGQNLMVVANQVELENVLSVPISAIREQNGTTRITLLEDGTLKHRYVTVGAKSPTEEWIVAGLQEGQQAVIE